MAARRAAPYRETVSHAQAPMAARLALHPAHPERICWGCDKYCAADDLRCGNGSDRAQHPIEIFGPDWLAAGLDAIAAPAVARADDAPTA